MAAEVKAEYLNLFIKIKETGVLLNALFVTNSAHSFLLRLKKMFTTLLSSDYSQCMKERVTIEDQ